MLKLYRSWFTIGRLVKLAKKPSKVMQILIGHGLVFYYCFTFTQDQGLDMISDGLDTLKNMAHDMNEVSCPALLLAAGFL